MTFYATFVDSIQAPDVAAANSGNTVIVNANQALPPYRSKEGEIGYKLRVRRINFSTALFRLERPFANYTLGEVNPVCGVQSGTANCEAYQITGNQLNYGVETMLSGRIFESLMVTGGLTVLDPKLTDTGIAATNNKDFVGIPDYKSNILAEYHLPKMTGAFLNFDWQHVGRRAIDDINSEYHAPVQHLRFRRPLHSQTSWESDHLARHRKQRHQCALLVDFGSGQHHGSEHWQLPRLTWASRG